MITGNLRSADKGTYQLDKLNTSTAHIKGTFPVHPDACMHARCQGIWLLLSPLLMREEGLCTAASAAHLLSRTIVQVVRKCFLDHIPDSAIIFHIHNAVSVRQVHEAVSDCIKIVGHYLLYWAVVC
jgi:hypothetical protein